ncbi:pre-mRNA-processing factor 39-like isoform X2 [Ascaphus truei]|uniref:pre-mRNA-processing factor 39-like isoform X2 n=1 Tax=Ascaphus truei TaxID=8439 RepID=UPI003F59A619
MAANRSLHAGYFPRPPLRGRRPLLGIRPPLLGIRPGFPPPRSPEIPLASEESPGSDDSNDAGEPDLPPNFSGLWDAAQESPHDFNIWIKLLEFVEKENCLIAGRKAYDAFLTRFPYCYGYWKKYADAEHHFKNEVETGEVYSRALQSFPLCVDLWIQYIIYLKDTLDMTLPESAERVRGVFKSAVASAGLNFHSDKLWELYTKWEAEQGNLRAVTALYDHVLRVPTNLYRQHYDSFKEHVSSNPPRDILTPEEFQWIRTKVVSEQENDQIATDDSPTAAEDDTAAVPEDPVSDLEYQEKMREQIIMIRNQLFFLNDIEIMKRWNYEEAITRPYFHVTPLDRGQLQNWRKYLEFEVSLGEHERIVTLYERCVVACALYEEFWLAYVRYMEGHSVDAARSIFQRVCQIHLPLKPSVHLQWAAFEEKHGQLESARAILRDLEQALPGLAIARLRRVSLERRSGHLDEAEQLLQDAVTSSAGTELAAFYAIKLARLLLKVQGDPAGARDVLTAALEREPDDPRLHLSLLEVEVSRDASQGEQDAVQCVERALQSRLHDDVKMILSQRRLEFLEDHGSSVTSVLQAYDEHQELLKQQEGLKRPAENVILGVIIIPTCGVITDFSTIDPGAGTIPFQFAGGAGVSEGFRRTAARSVCPFPGQRDRAFLPCINRILF